MRLSRFIGKPGESDTTRKHVEILLLVGLNLTFEV